MTTYDLELIDTPRVGDAQHSASVTAIVDHPRMIESIFVAEVLTRVEGFALSSSQSYDYQAGAAVAEVLKLHAEMSGSTIYRRTLIGAMQLRHIISLAIPKMLTDGVVIHDLRKVVLAVTVIQRLALRGTLLGSTIYGVALAQALAVHDSFANFFGGVLTDALR